MSLGTRVLTPEAFCFIIDKTDDSRLEFQLMPQTITESKSALWNEIPIIGRSLPLVGYSGSTSRSMSISLQFAAMVPNGSDPENPVKYSSDWVIKQVRWLESKTYPSYTGDIVRPPPGLVVIIGQALGMQCTLNSVSTTWEGPWAIDGPKATAFRAQVDCAFVEYGENMDRGRPFDRHQAVEGINQEGGGSLGGSSYIQIPRAIQEAPNRFLVQRIDFEPLPPQTLP